MKARRLRRLLDGLDFEEVLVALRVTDGKPSEEWEGSMFEVESAIGRLQKVVGLPFR